jgi:hypothetical protein
MIRCRDETRRREEKSLESLAQHTDDHPLLVLGFAGRPDAGEALWLIVRAVTPTGTLCLDTLRASQVGARDAELESSTNACPWCE